MVTGIEDFVKESPDTHWKRLKQYLHDEIFTLNFYRVHMSYFVFATLISSVIIYGPGLAVDPDEVAGNRLRSQHINLGNLTAFQQAWLSLLLLGGSIVFVSTFIVIVRIYYFRKRLTDVVHHSHSGRQILKDIQREENLGLRPKTSMTDNQTDDAGKLFNGRASLPKTPLRAQRQSEIQGQQLLRRRKPAHQSGFGSFHAPWEIPSVRRTFHWPFKGLKRALHHQEWPYVSFSPNLDDRGRVHGMNEHERAELGGVEYRALRLLLVVLVAYQVFWLVFGSVFLAPYAYRYNVSSLLRSVQPGNLKPGWWAFFTTITSFANGGLNLLNQNFVPLRGFDLILIVAALVSVAGNTQFPIFLRLNLRIIAKLVPKNSHLRETAIFLLHHPRRCFIYLFPAREIWYLFAIQVTIDLTAWVLFMILNIGIPEVESIPAPTRTLDGLFQAIGLRKSGAYIVTVSYYAPALLVAYVVAMYISNFPVVMALRKTNTYEERSIGLDAKETTEGGLGVHIRNQLAYDLWFQILAWFIICIIERGPIRRAAHGVSVFYILFEVPSAYGTVGLSTGVPGRYYSLSGSFHKLSKLVICLVMLRGRHRGLPLAIDRSILLPGQDLMHQMDEEYNSRGAF